MNKQATLAGSAILGQRGVKAFGQAAAEFDPARQARWLNVAGRNLDKSRSVMLRGAGSEEALHRGVAFNTMNAERRGAPMTGAHPMRRASDKPLQIAQGISVGGRP